MTLVIELGFGEHYFYIIPDLRLDVHFQYYDAYPRYNYYSPDVSIQRGMLYVIIA